MTQIAPFWPIERRVLAYLDQHGATHRLRVVQDLSPEDSRTNTRKQGGGSNGGVPLVMGAWCRRLQRDGLVRACSDQQGFYRHHEITPLGRQRLRRT